VPLGHVLPTQAFLKKESSHLVYPQAVMEAKKVSFQQRNPRMGLDGPRRWPRPLSVPRCRAHLPKVPLLRTPIPAQAPPPGGALSSSEFRQWFDEAAVSGVSRINKSKVENLTKTSKEVVDAAKLAGVNLLSTSIQKPLAKHSKDIDGLGKQVKAMEGDVKKMQTSIKDLKAGVTTAVGKAKTSQGMSETKMLEIVKASDLKRAADLKILIESEVRA
ncbi:unnamed protein product, partial [Pylaiella littoralis]